MINELKGRHFKELIGRRKGITLFPLISFANSLAIRYIYLAAIRGDGTSPTLTRECAKKEKGEKKDVKQRHQKECRRKIRG